MDSPGPIQVVSLIILIFLSGFFSSAETAFVSCNKARMRSLADDGDKKAARVLRILEKGSKMLSTVLIGNNIVNLSASAISTMLATEYFGMPVGIMTGILTFVILIVGEVVPKTWATVSADKMAMYYSIIISSLMVVFTPLIFIVDGISKIILFIMRVDPDKKTDAITEDAIKTYVDVSHEDGEIEPEEREMIYNLFDFTDHVAKDIMIPKVRMVCIDVESTYDEVLAVFRECMYTRLPVYEGEKEHIIGVINMKEFIGLDDHDSFKVRDIMREAYFTHEFKKTQDLLAQMRKETFNIVFVLSEYGTMEGMITLEDLLEELVGEIRDEFDEDEKELIKKQEDGKYVVEGALSIDDFNEAVGTTLSSEEYDSIGGIIIEHLDHMPEDGEEVTLDDGTVLKVAGIDQNRIVEVEITLSESALEEIAKKAESEADAEEEDNEIQSGEKADTVEAKKD
ncbi:MAG: hemolysin family protein [Lachnospiraceae bacterium]|nr:hemolysin family protein [Lachnospiraceae bacterium]